jgi:hypothetical protein
MFYLSHQCQVIFFTHIFWKKACHLFHLLGLDTDPYQPDSDWHTMDINLDPNPAK